MNNQNLLQKATFAALIGAILNTVLFYGAQLAGLQIQVTQGPNSTTLMDLPVIAVVLASALPAFIAAGLYALLHKMGSKGPILFQVVGWGFLMLSMFPVMGLPGSVGVKVVLALMHVVAGVTILTLLPARSPNRPAVARN